ncbi:family 88 glycosyl hydrolase [Amanita rubescens]|nr:family 88 glycosyl hydrolase [Amanita rubescens]
MTKLFNAATFLILGLRTAAAASLHSKLAIPYDPGFDIFKVLQLAVALPVAFVGVRCSTRTISVFGDAPFPAPMVTASESISLTYASNKFQIGNGSNTLINGAGAVGDPASLGISAYLLGKTNATLAAAAIAELDYVLYQAPRYSNGAISQRADVAELWSDFMYMAPPFIAYYGAATNNLTILQQAVDQSTFYRQILAARIKAFGPQGNGWAAAGMTRVLATVLKAPIARRNPAWQRQAVYQLSSYIQEILDAAIMSGSDLGLLHNYWNPDQGSNHTYGEASGTSLLAAVAYRMAVLPCGLSDAKVLEYSTWADAIRFTLGGTDLEGNPHVTSNGTVTPTVDPLDWQSPVPYTAGSPEGQNFVVLMYAAWRDCVKAGVCEGYDILR